MGASCVLIATRAALAFSAQMARGLQQVDGMIRIHTCFKSCGGLRSSAVNIDSTFEITGWPPGTAHRSRVEDILRGMGFSDQQIKDAIERCDGNKERAADMLLS